MDAQYLKRLEEMLKTTNKKIVDLKSIKNPQEQEAKRRMLLASKKDLEDRIAAAKRNLGIKDNKKPESKPAKKTKKTLNKKSTKKAKTTKKTDKKVTKPASKKNTVKKANKPVTKKVVKKDNKNKAASKAKSNGAEKKKAKQDAINKKTADKQAKIDAKNKAESKRKADQEKRIKKAKAEQKAKEQQAKLVKQQRLAKQQAKQEAKAKAAAKAKANAEKKRKQELAKEKTAEKKAQEEKAKAEKEQQAKIAADKKAKADAAKKKELAKKKIADDKKAKALAKKKAKQKKKAAKAAKQQAKQQRLEALEREQTMKREQQEKEIMRSKAKVDKISSQHKSRDAAKAEKNNEINELASKISTKVSKQEEQEFKQEEQKAESKVSSSKNYKGNIKPDDQLSAELKERAAKRETIKKGEFIKIDLPEIPNDGIKSMKAILKRQKQLTNKYSKKILDGAIVTTTDYKPDVEKHIIELHDVRKSYITGDIETPILKGINIKLDKGDFIVILGPSGSGKTTFLNSISGLDKATSGDVFDLGYNLSYLKDSHLTKFRRKHVGFIFQQYNLLTNLTAKENAEVGENLASSKNPDMTIEDIFETIGMKDQMNKYPHQMSGGQQQRVSIARALAKNPDILFADEPTGALDEEMGRKVLEILVEVNKRYGTTVIVVTHNPNIAKIGNTVIHIKNGLIDEVEKNAHPEDPSKIDWA